MRRYGWDDYDRGYRGREAEPHGFYDRGYRGPEARPHHFHDRGYRHGWGMAGLNDAFLHGPRPEALGYDHAIHRVPRRRTGYDEGWFGPRSGPQGARPGPGPMWRSGYDRYW